MSSAEVMLPQVNYPITPKHPSEEIILNTSAYLNPCSCFIFHQSIQSPHILQGTKQMHCLSLSSRIKGLIYMGVERARPCWTLQNQPGSVPDLEIGSRDNPICGQEFHLCGTALPGEAVTVSVRGVPSLGRCCAAVVRDCCMRRFVPVLSRNYGYFSSEVE